MKNTAINKKYLILVYRVHCAIVHIYNLSCNTVPSQGFLDNKIPVPSNTYLCLPKLKALEMKEKKEM